jgi:hypothetical protein
MSIAACLLAGCEKVIDAGLHDGESKYVIEGIVNNTGTCSVLVSSTLRFSDNNNFHGISSALIQITDNGGSAVTLTQSSAGVYASTLIKGTPGHTYHLQVAIGQDTFTATCIMPVQVKLDTIGVALQSFSGHSKLVANVTYTDPPEPGNYYHFVQYINQRQDAGIFVSSDNLTNGRLVNLPLVSPLTLQTDDENDIRKGDTVRIEMQCIDANVYKYWYSLNTASTGSDVLATPANAVSNISGGALGYFSAHTAQKKKVIVK